MSFFSRFGRFMVLFGRLMKTTFQILYGVIRISKLHAPIVSIFGGSKLPENSPYMKQAHEMGKRLTHENVSILTGGGPGIMEAISCGAIDSKMPRGRVMGIGVRTLGDKRNMCVDDYFELEYFFARKWLLIQYSSAFIIFPGGFGTVDELAEVLTLMQTGTLPVVPMVLIGKEYWKDFLDWISDEMISHKTIVPEELSFFKVTDDLDEALCWVIGKCKVQ